METSESYTPSESEAMSTVRCFAAAVSSAGRASISVSAAPLSMPF